MTARYFGTSVNHELTGSEVSNSDSLIQEFQEFEAQVYSGTLFNKRDKNLSRSATVHTSTSHLPNQQQKAVSLDDPSGNKLSKQQAQCSQVSLSPGTSLGYRNNLTTEHTGSVTRSDCIQEDDEGSSHVEDDSLDEAECLASVSSNKRKSGPNQCYANDHFSRQARSSDSQCLTHVPEIRSKGRPDGNLQQPRNVAKLAPACVTSFGLPISSASAHTAYLNQNMTMQLFPSALSHSQSTPRLNPQSVRAAIPELSYPLISDQSFAPSPIRRTESAQFATKPVVSVDENGEDLELVNPHPVLAHAKEDPIETHDQVVAEMAAQGMIWAPSQFAAERDNQSGVLTTSLVANNDGSTKDTRWYSAGIEEEVLTEPSERWVSESKTHAGSDSFVSRGGPIGDVNSHCRARITQPSLQGTTNPCTPSNLPTRPPDVNSFGLSLSAPVARDVRSVSLAVAQNGTLANDSTTKTTDSLMQINDEGQMDLKARLDHEIALRKQQDDYIRQLQKYYDNLLTKHALAEVTIDQLRVGAKVRSESEDRALSHCNPQRSSDLSLIGRSSRYQSQPLAALPSLRRQSMVFGTSTEQLLASGPQLRCASTPMLIPSAKQRQQQQQQLGQSVSSRDWSSPQAMKPHTIDGPGSHNHIDMRQMDWTFGNEKYASFEHCHTVPEERKSNYFDKSDTPPPSAQSEEQQRPSSSPVPLKSTKSQLPNVPQEQLDSKERDAAPVFRVDRNSHCVRQAHQHDEPVVSLRYSQERQSSPSDDDVALSPGEVHLDLMTNLIELRAKLDQMKRRLADHDASLRESDIRPIRGRYIQLKKCYHLAKRRWAAFPDFDPNLTLDKELFQVRLHLDDIEACLQLNESPRNERISFSQGTTVVDNYGRNVGSNRMPLAGLHVKYPRVMDSGVLSSPSRSDREQDSSSLSNPLMTKDNLRAFEDLFIDLMDRYNKLKQMDPTNTQASRLYHIMKRLYALAAKANGHSSVIPTPEELESLFQLDGDTQKLSEDLEKIIRTEREMSAYSSYSNVSGRNSYVDRGPAQMISNPMNGSHLDFAPSTSTFEKNTNLPRQERNSHHLTGSCSDESNSTQDSGLSMPPVAQQRTSRGGKSIRSLHLHSVPPNSKLRCVPVIESDSSPTAKSAPTYSTQGHPSDSGLPGSVPTNKTSWSNTADPPEVKSQMMNQHTSGSLASDYLIEASQVDDSTKKRMEAIEAGIRFLQQKMIEVCNRSQTASVCCGTSSANKKAENSSLCDSSDGPRNPSTNPLCSTSRSCRQRKQRPLGLRHPTPHQTLAPNHVHYHGGSTESEAHLSGPANGQWMIDGLRDRQRPKTVSHTPVPSDYRPLRCYGTAYDRWASVRSTNNLGADARTHRTTENAFGRLAVCETDLRKHCDCRSNHNIGSKNRSPADISSDDNQSDSPVNDAELYEVSECSDPDDCSSRVSCTPDSATDYLERDVSLYPRRDPKLQLIVGHDTPIVSSPIHGHPINSNLVPCSSTKSFCSTVGLGRATSVAHDLHQLPRRSTLTIPPHHFGGSMPMLVDPHECCDAHTVNANVIPPDACQRRHAGHSRSLQLGTEFHRPPPPKPAFYTEPHLVSTCGTCGGSGRVSSLFPDPIRPPLVPNAARRVLSFANLIQEGSYARPINQTCIREYTEVGGRRYTVRELACNAQLPGLSPFSLRMHPWAKNVHQRRQLIDSSESGSSGTSVTNEPTNIVRITSASRPAPRRSMMRNRNPCITTRDPALNRLLIAANSVTALTRDLRKSLEDVCGEANPI